MFTGNVPAPAAPAAALPPGVRGGLGPGLVVRKTTATRWRPSCSCLAVILVAAKLAGDLAARLGQPAVLGELVVGVLLGNLSLLG